MEVCSGVWRCVVGCGDGVVVCGGVWRWCSGVWRSVVVFVCVCVCVCRACVLGLKVSESRVLS